MQDLADGFLAAPLWAQIGMVGFALVFVAMMVTPRLAHRRARNRFAALAGTRGATVTQGHDEFAASFEAGNDGRTFTVRRELRGSMRGSGYRGPRGHRVVVETPLSGSRWELHGVDIAEAGALPREGSRPLRTGDSRFDARFTVWQDGVEGARSRRLDVDHHGHSVRPRGWAVESRAVSG